MSVESLTRNLSAEFRAASNAAFGVHITAERSRRVADIRHDIAITDGVNQLGVEINRRQFCAID